MEVTSYLILVAFVILGAIVVIKFIVLKHADEEILGHASITRIHFYAGKLAMFIPWLLFIYSVFNHNIGFFEPTKAMIWISVILLLLGAAGMIAGLIDLGNSLRIGLPGDGIILKTKGIYRLSRNPLYVSAILISIASCIYFPDLINFAFTIYAIVVHHRIILSEEEFLRSRFGSGYDDYCGKVRRYI